LALLQAFPDVPSILDAGSVHEGTDLLKEKVDWLIGSAKFARKSTGLHNLKQAAKALSKINKKVIITDGDKDCHWSINGKSGQTPAFSVDATDSNGAGDVFHGAFAYGLTQGIEFEKNILFSSKIAALSCTGIGIRNNIPKASDILSY
jgi:sulfofructose kinase